MSKKIKKPEQLWKKANEKAQSYGGKLLTKKWLGYQVRHVFEYSDGRQFEITPSQIFHGYWPKNLDAFFINQKRAFRNDEQKLQELKKYIENKGGELLTRTWSGASSMYEVKDQAGITFENTATRILQGIWSPDKGLVSEPICRQVLEHLYQKKFPKTKAVLTTKIVGGNYPWELDGYCKELNVAFEYQGYPSHWDNTHPSYETTIKRDKEKKEHCLKLNIILIQIPVFKGNVNNKSSLEVINHIYTALELAYKEQKQALPTLNTKNFKIDYTSIHHGKDMFEKLKTIAQHNKGEILSKRWLGSNAKHKFKHEDGTVFEMVASKVFAKMWPQDIQSYLKYSEAMSKSDQQQLKDLAKLAKQNGFELITPQWMGVRYYYQFKNKNTQELIEINRIYLNDNGWPNDIEIYKKFQLSQKTENSNRLENLRLLAKQNGFELISKTWLGSDKKHQFRFIGDERIFERTFNKIKQEGWPQNKDYFFKINASQNKTPNEFLKEMAQFAQQQNCVLISTEWKGIHYRYQFTWEDGRKFEVSYNNMFSKTKSTWPKNEEYFTLSALRTKKPEEFLAEFKAIVEEKLKGQLLESQWLGNNNKHRIQIDDKIEEVTPKYIKMKFR